ncbi:oxidoreductase [Nocardia nova]|uniref:SDR family oxidoreductase n=1 Tax=Nocardia nova TaxID=37330 RepID=UPI000CE9DD06|nr:SDR family oxidoreductase [Nocardia nova]PPJ07820.1 oxidoreductase [Nocardia nova]
MAHNRFDGKIALVTGGTSGMGLATARRLRDEGARVIVTGRDPGRLAATADELGPEALAIAGDTADLAAIDAVFETVRNGYGRLDVLFVNAGIGFFPPTDAVTEADFDRVIGVNLKGVFFTVQKAIPLLAPDAAVVINASWALHRGMPSGSLYSATKAAAHNLARTFAAELGAKGIRVNSVSPGYIDTPALRAELPEAVQSAVAGDIVAGRIGSAEDVAATVAFLASSEASYITGQDLLVDGGLVGLVPSAAT